MDPLYNRHFFLIKIHYRQTFMYLVSLLFSTKINIFNYYYYYYCRSLILWTFSIMKINYRGASTLNDFYCLQNAMAVCWNMRDVLINNVELLKRNKQSQKVNTEPKKSRLIDSITPTRKPKVINLRWLTQNQGWLTQ